MNCSIKEEKGISLIELLIVIALTGVIVGGLSQTIQSVFMIYNDNRYHQDLLMCARKSLDRMSMFIRATDAIISPESGIKKEVIIVSERVIDLYDNKTHSPNLSGDGIPDADNDANGLINDDEAGDDPKEYVTFRLNRDNPVNTTLTETLPDYGTPSLSDKGMENVLCEHVLSLEVRQLSKKLIEIVLVLKGKGGPLSFRTRVLAPLIEEEDVS